MRTKGMGTKMLKSTIPTQFRLSVEERSFLIKKGHGSVTDGLRNVMVRAGLRKDKVKVCPACKQKIRRG